MPFRRTPTRRGPALERFFRRDLKRPIESNKSLQREYVVTRSEDAFDITSRIIRDLYSADVVICDLSGRHSPNANVMYELGVRLSVSARPVILIRERHRKNQRVFDIAGFHTFDYDPTDYEPLKRYIIEKIRKFESEEEAFESPVLHVLKHEPSVLRQLERTRVHKLLEGLHVGLTGYLRCLCGALAEFLGNHRSPLQVPRSAMDLLAFLQTHDSVLSQLDWRQFHFEPRPTPALAAVLAEMPLADVPELVEVHRAVTSALSEYFVRFFATNMFWTPATIPELGLFVGETTILIQVVRACHSLCRTTDPLARAAFVATIQQSLRASHFILRPGAP